MQFTKTLTLSAYTAMTGSFLSIIGRVDGQIKYVDIDPDLVVSEPGVYQDLDMDGNGTVDFAFINTSGTFYSPGYGCYIHNSEILAFLSDTQSNHFQAIAGISQENATKSYGYYFYDYPFALPLGAMIAASLTWQTGHAQILAKTQIHSDDGWVAIGPFADWFNSEITETIDKYLGVRFIASDSLDHYGWIRCDVVDAGSTLIIKSYAYNEIPGQGIIAGKQLADEEVPLYDLYWHIYSSDNQIIVETDLNIAGHSEVRVFNTQGAIIYENVLAEAITYISMENLVSGVYIVHVQNAFTNTSKKVIIH